MFLFRNRWLFFIVNIVITFLLFLGFAPIYDLKHFINALFYVNFIYMMIGLFLFTAKGKFFDSITHSFIKVGRSLSKERDLLDELEEIRLPSEWFSANLLNKSLTQGVLLLIIMLILLAIYYV